MKIELLDKIFNKNIFAYRTCKIRYSYAFENCLRNKILLLKKEYNVYTINELFTESNDNSVSKSKFKEWGIGLVKNLLGLIPDYGTILTIIFSITDTVSFLKISDLEKLRERLQLKGKPRRKYRKVKNIIIIKNCAYLNADDIKKVQFINELIDKKYIINTLLIICEPLDFPSNLIVDKDAVYTIALDNHLVNDICGFCVDGNYLKLINVLGIEYAEYIKNLDDLTAINNDLLVQKFVKDMLQKGGYDEDEKLLDFLKLCSLLFDVFSYEDIESVSGIKEICCEVELEKSVNSNLIENSMPNEYRFFMKFLRKYYQEHAQFYGSEIKRQILDYLKEKYPFKYTDLALASILTSNSDSEKISLCLKSLYYDKNTTVIYKLNQIIEYLSKSSYATLASISQLNDIYYSLDYSNADVKQLCMQSFLGLSELDFLSPEDKLICLASIAKVSYELMSQEFLKKIDELYRKLLRDIRISTTYKKYTLFILDYLVFSTCIEDSFETTQVAQRLVEYLRKTPLSLENEIKFSRLGNALFYNDYSEGMKLTKRAYNLSEGYPIEQKYSAINYSCSLGTCGEYEEAYRILKKEFNDTFCTRNVVSISATNNYIIISYLNNSKNVKWLIDKLSDLNEMINDYVFSDQQIINNNLLAAYIVENNAINYSKIIEFSSNILSNERDIYHLFFMHHNMMIYHFLVGDLDAFKRERDLCIVPGLLAPYSNFFVSKADFLQENIYSDWDIKQLQQQLNEWGNCYPEKKYVLYKYPILFGFIERWFE
ncbi:MAG: hypothetical protein J6B89_04545 [Bacilli bacterium]|nr:hypothetical protein [Bacilli bacterium]